MASSLTEIQNEANRLRERLRGPTELEVVEQVLDGLLVLVADLAERVETLAEVNDMWDGS